MLDEIYKNMQKHTEGLSIYATKDEDAIYLKNRSLDIRTPFFRDIDKIIYSLSFIRYNDKTQVFTQKANDHIQKRMLHVQYVSKIARTIGRALGLNEDLIEAASLGHDLGHCPYGHVGEKCLDEISLSLNEGHFNHNINSVRNLLYVENYGEGQNISLQVLDAIMCHNGEILTNKLTSKKKDIDTFLTEYQNAYTDEIVCKNLIPMTMEGIVVRISDIIAYIGRDIEDGIRLGLISWNDVPENIKKVLGSSNSEIVNTVICDIIKNSMNKEYIKMSQDVYNALLELKDFNYQNIYFKAYNDEERKEIKKKFTLLTNKFLKDLNDNNTESPIFSSFIKHMNDNYLKSSKERIVLDYISGMTDKFFNEQYELISKSSE